MKIAIIGSGISGLTAAWLLHRQHDIRVFEANSYIGGHTNTVDFELDGRSYAIDTGFIVCNDRTYPNFLTLLDHLGVARTPTSMGFSVRCDTTNLEYSGSGLGGLFAQKRNLVRPFFLWMVSEILRFYREGNRDADTVDHDLTVGDYLEERGYTEAFVNYHLLPMGAAIWSCPTGTFRDFSIRFILEFYRHHGLLSLKNRPTWYVIQGGSRQYVDRLTAPFASRIRLNTPVQEVVRHEVGVTVATDEYEEQFDEVIFACHSDQALRLLSEPSGVELEILGAFPYQPNSACLHTDTSVLPRRRKVWSSWNYRVHSNRPQDATLTYDMNQLQHIDSPHQFCVTLNETDSIDRNRIIGTYRYSHPIFTTTRFAMQQRHSELIRRNRTSFCGAYWGNGFHEDGVRSALDVCRQFGAADILDTDLSRAGELEESPDRMQKV